MGVRYDAKAGAGRRRGASRGFTLIELMVVVAVVAILVSIAVPAYSEAVRKSKRGQAKADLIEAAQIAERHRTINNSYENLSAGSAAADEIKDQSPKTGTADYTIAVNVAADFKSYTITATPQGGQTQDRCGILTINHLGAKTHQKGDVSQCQFGTVAAGG